MADEVSVTEEVTTVVEAVEEGSVEIAQSAHVIEVATNETTVL